jgi:hypothetical protein
MKRSITVIGLVLTMALMSLCCLSCSRSGPSYALPISASHTLSADHPVSVYNDALAHRKPIVMVFTQKGG